MGYIQQITLRLFPRETVNFASVDSASANIEILGKQNEDRVHQKIEQFQFSVDKNLVPESFQQYRILFLHFSRAIYVVSYL